MRVQVTVVVTDGNWKGGIARVESTTLVLPAADSCIFPDGHAGVVANAARLVAERAIFGRLLPTPVRDGGRG